MTKTELTRMNVDIEAMSDAELERFAALAQTEIAAREKRRKEDIIARIRALAEEGGLSVAIDGARGRPGGKSAKKRGGIISDKPATAA